MRLQAIVIISGGVVDLRVDLQLKIDASVSGFLTRCEQYLEHPQNNKIKLQ